MKKTHFLSAILISACLLAGCNEAPGSAGESGKGSAGTGATRAVSTAAIAAEATGFTVGQAMAARTVYVFFDPQCPHCSELWRNAKPLNNKVKFVWIPVGLMNATSSAQGASLLAAADPVAAMDEHEASMSAKRGGIGAGNATEAHKNAIKKNTALLNQFGFTSIPTIVSSHAQTGAVVTNQGSMTTAALSGLLGL
jgi:thiol:disulfide interchange protein DsbG